MEDSSSLGVPSLPIEVRVVSVVLSGSDIFVNSDRFILRDVITVVSFWEDSIGSKLTGSLLESVH